MTQNMEDTAHILHELREFLDVDRATKRVDTRIVFMDINKISTIEIRGSGHPEYPHGVICIFEGKFTTIDSRTFLMTDGELEEFKGAMKTLTNVKFAQLRERSAPVRYFFTFKESGLTVDFTNLQPNFEYGRSTQVLTYFPKGDVEKKNSTVINSVSPDEFDEFTAEFNRYQHLQAERRRMQFSTYPSSATRLKK